jgi:uncharacterized Ntn-hydrolase superfamily protein
MSALRRPGTFSIVACDDQLEHWGVAVATKPMGVGGIVPWAEWRSGALATQADSNYSYGARGLAALRRGRSAGEVVRLLTRADPGRERRQLGVVDRRGRTAAWTGAECHAWAGHFEGDRYACQGNLLAGDRVVPAMARAFEATKGPIARRLYAALVAGAKEGGDRRGTESAALLVVHREPWYDAAWADRWVDLRVDQSPTPVAELGRLLALDEANTRRMMASREIRERRLRWARRSARSSSPSTAPDGRGG